jgi:hypothetical protein
MTTGSFENWAGNIADLGAIYPFVGWEAVLCILAVVLWIVWHVVQARGESRQYNEEIERFGKPETLRKIINNEDPSKP